MATLKKVRWAQLLQVRTKKNSINKISIPGGLNGEVIPVQETVPTMNSVIILSAILNS